MIGITMLYAVLHRLSSLVKARSRLAGIALLVTCSWVAVPAAMAQGGVARAPTGTGAAAPGAAAAPPSAMPATESAVPPAPAKGGTDAPASPADATASAPAGDIPGGEGTVPPDTRSLDQEVWVIKKDVGRLNRDLP